MLQTTTTLPRGVRRLALFASLAIASSSTAQVQWRRLSTANEPSPRARSGVAYDEARDQIVLFGGYTGGSPLTIGDTWLFDGANWTQAVTAAAPSARQFSRAAYDRRRGRVVLFGGMEWTSNSFPWVVHDDTWEWDGSAWTRRTPQTSPPPRAMAGLAYDEGRGRIVLYGGYAYVNTSTVVNLDDTWEWDGTNWLRTSPTVRPSVRADPKLFYDQTRQHVVMTGGVFDNGTGNSMYLTGTWEWDGTNWTRLTPSMDPVATPEESVAYDVSRRRAVRYQYLNSQVFEWDGTTWMPRTPAATRPQDRIGTNMVYDRTGRRTVLFGGRTVVGAGSVIGETWSYSPLNPADFETFGAGCAGSAGVPELSSDELPWTGGAFSGQVANLPANAPAVLYLGVSRTDYAGIALPLDLTFIGASGCTLFASLDLGLGLAAANGAAPWTLAIPGDAALHGQTFFVQGIVLDPAANPFGVTFSNSAAATVGGR